MNEKYRWSFLTHSVYADALSSSVFHVTFGGMSRYGAIAPAST